MIDLENVDDMLLLYDTLVDFKVESPPLPHVKEDNGLRYDTLVRVGRNTV